MRAVERVELSHVLFREGEVEDLGVFCNAFTVRRFGDHDKTALQGPAQQHLRGGASDGFGGALDHLVREVTARPQRTVRLYNNIPLLCSLEQRATVLEGTELDLIHDW